jgi:hypothetical protein
MKKIALTMALICFALSLFSQATSDTTFSKDYYLQKSKNQKTTGWVLLAGGTTMAIVGTLIFSKSDFLSGDPDADIGGVLFVGGLVADLVSIPFFISSSKNARKAATITINNQKILSPQQNAFTFKPQPTITLKIGL